MGSAFPAEALLEAAVRRAPRLHELLPLDEAEGRPADPRLRRCRRPGPPLATRAVTVTSVTWGLGELEADSAADATAGERRRHGESIAVAAKLTSGLTDPRAPPAPDGAASRARQASLAPIVGCAGRPIDSVRATPSARSARARRWSSAPRIARTSAR